MKSQIYLVGGAVRDKILGLKPKDFDYCVIAGSYEEMRQIIIDRGGEIFLETPQYFTIRAKVPDFGSADFVLARKEGSYSDGRRPDYVEVGDLKSELSRRDFTMNAIAQDEDGNLIDPFNGQEDIQDKVIRCVGNASHRFNEDKLRLLRAFRFSITKKFRLDGLIQICLESDSMIAGLKGVSTERIREELTKCFEFNTYDTLIELETWPLLRKACFSHNIKLKPTIYEQKNT